MKLHVGCGSKIFPGWTNLDNCYILPYTLCGYSRLGNYRCSGFWLRSIRPQIFSPVFSLSSNPLKIFVRRLPSH